jgi:hypothetical protein
LVWQEAVAFILPLLANRPRAAELLHACELSSVRHGVRQIPGSCSITFFISGCADCFRQRVVIMDVRVHVHVHESRRRTTSCAARGRANCEDHRAGGDLLGQRDRVRDRVEIEFCTASHAIDATSARRRGGVGLTPLDSVDMAASSPKVHPDSLVDFHTGPCSSRRASRPSRGRRPPSTTRPRLRRRGNQILWRALPSPRHRRDAGRESQLWGSSQILSYFIRLVIAARRTLSVDERLGSSPWAARGVARELVPARWRGSYTSRFSITAAPSPRNDLVKNYQVHPTH